MIAASICCCFIKFRAKRKHLLPYHDTSKLKENGIKMESNNELKEIYIKNCTSYYFDDIIKIEFFDFDDILLDEKSYKNILLYDISYKYLIGAKPLRIRFDKVDGFIRVYDGTRYLVLFDPDKYDSIYHRIRYLLSLKSGITYFIFHNYARIKIQLIFYL